MQVGRSAKRQPSTALDKRGSTTLDAAAEAGAQDKGQPAAAAAAAVELSLAQMLLKGPAVVVVDEAHILKGEASGRCRKCTRIPCCTACAPTNRQRPRSPAARLSQAKQSKALNLIKTKRRLGLTGYPLQNNLSEMWVTTRPARCSSLCLPCCAALPADAPTLPRYPPFPLPHNRHAMISWCDPDLITSKEWDREYAQPIMAGALRSAAGEAAGLACHCRRRAGLHGCLGSSMLRRAGVWHVTCMHLGPQCRLAGQLPGATSHEVQLMNERLAVFHDLTSGCASLACPT